MTGGAGNAGDGGQAGANLDGTITRLRRLEGQVRGLQRMLEDGRDCSEVIPQYLAARAALDEIGARMLDAELERCLQGRELQTERISKMLRLWLRTSH